MTSTRDITPIILAAGDSTRMGYPKALLPLEKDTFLTRILGILQQVGLSTPIVIVGNAADAIKREIGDRAAIICHNPNPGRGQLSSIQLGLERVDPKCLAAMIWPVDQPAVSADLVRGLVKLFRASAPSIVCPLCAGRRGHPAIFHRVLFAEFMEAPLNEGPKAIILRRAEEIALLPTGEKGSIEDIDTPEEYRKLTGRTLDGVRSVPIVPKPI